MGRQYHNAPHHGLSLAARVVLCVLLALFFLLAPASSPAQGASSPSPGSSGAVWVMSLDGPIGPALSDWFVRSLDDANNAVLYFRVLDAQKAVINVEDFYSATSQLSQTTLRSVLGKHELDEMLASRDELNSDIQEILDEQSDNWGIKVTNVEIKHVDLDEGMVRVIARQAEAERIRRAKVIHANGEKEASQVLLEAASTLARQPQALQLRYLQTLTEVANERSSTIVFPLPMDLIESFTKRDGNDE